MNVNCNQWAGVRLTAIGRRIYRDHYAQFGNPREPEVDAEGWTWLLLWQVMHIFGPHIYLGCDEPFDANLELEPDGTRPPSHAV